MKYVASFYYFLVGNSEYIYNGCNTENTPSLVPWLLSFSSPSSSLHVPTDSYFALTDAGVGTRGVYAMEGGESPPPVLLPSEGEIPSPWEGDVQAKLTPPHLKDVGRKETEGKKVGQGTVSSSSPLFPPAPPPGLFTSRFSGFRNTRYVWKRQEHWAVGTLPGTAEGDYNTRQRQVGCHSQHWVVLVSTTPQTCPKEWGRKSRTTTGNPWEVDLGNWDNKGISDRGSS